MTNYQDIGFGVEIRGMEEMKTILRQLPFQLRTRLVRQALAKSSKPIKEESVRLAPRRKGSKGGTIKRSITILNETRTDEPMVIIGPLKGKKFQSNIPGKNKDAWYARFHEFGTSGFGKGTKRITNLEYKNGAIYKRRIRTFYSKSGQRGAAGLPALEFMQRAFDAKHQEALSNQRVELSNIVTKYLRKHAPKYYVN